jgi:hypothetical protein
MKPEPSAGEAEVSVIAPYDREALREQFRSAKPFPWMKIDGFLDSKFADEVTASYPTFEMAAELGHEFSAVNENKKVQIVDYEKFPSPVKRLSDAISNPQFLEDLAFITGLPKLVWDPEFAGGGMHQTARSGWLDVHVDFNYHSTLHLHRRLNILVFLNPVWKQEWGGEFELWDEKVERRQHSVMPIHNRCVVFETSEISWHGVTAVTCPDGVARKSFAAYYYTKEAPVGWDGVSHSTIFKARPEEYMKRHVLMPAAAAGETVQRGVRAAKDAVKRLLNRS